MCIAFRTVKKICMNELFDGRLASNGIYENHLPHELNDDARCLTDGKYLLSVYGEIDGGEMHVAFLRMHDGTRSVNILAAIAEAFDTEMISGPGVQYGGFDSEEEWDEALRAASASRAGLEGRAEERRANMLKLANDLSDLTPIEVVETIKQYLSTHSERLQRDLDSGFPF